jgi:small-conductance mechanosensitive channel
MLPFGKKLTKKSKSFVSYWSTYNTSGSSGANQIKLPLTSTGIYSFIVDWGDGSSNKITSWNQTETTHTSSPDTYKVTITGVLTGWVLITQVIG